MPIGMYRRKHLLSSAKPQDKRDRGSGYVESPAKLERQLAEGLERTRAMLDEQRARIKREADVQRGSAGPATAGKTQFRRTAAGAREVNHINMVQTSLPEPV